MEIKPDYDWYRNWKEVQYSWYGKMEVSKYKTGIDFIDGGSWSGVGYE